MEPGAPSNSHPGSAHPSFPALLGASPAHPDLSADPGRARGCGAPGAGPPFGADSLGRRGRGGVERADSGRDPENDYWDPLTVPVHTRLEWPFPA